MLLFVINYLTFYVENPVWYITYNPLKILTFNFIARHISLLNHRGTLVTKAQMDVEQIFVTVYNTLTQFQLALKSLC